MLQLLVSLCIALVVFGSSIWVLIDAQRLGVRGEGKGMTSNSPAAWFAGCVLLWIVVFPLYLVTRSKVLAARSGGSPDAPLAEIAPRLASRGVVPRRSAGAPAWVGPASLAVGVASVPLAIFGILASPLWIGGLVLGVWGVAAGGRGRTHAVVGLIASVLGFFAMVAAIVLMAHWMQRQQG